MPIEDTRDENQSRLDLQNWLVTICENRSLSSNPDVKEFLSYEMEEHLTLNNNNNNINNNNNAKRIAQPVLPSSAVSQNPRIDKVREASLKSSDA